MRFKGVVVIPLAALAVLGGIWTVSTLLLAGGTGPITAVALALLVTAGVPATVAAYKHGKSRWPTAMPGVALAWNLAAIGLLALATPDPLGMALREHGWMLSAHAVGEEHRATRTASMLSHEVAEALSPAADAVVEVVPDDKAIFVDVELVGPDASRRLRYLWDTGASYTTITREVADELGIAVVEDAPEVELETAAGPRRSRLAYLPAIRIGEHEVRGLAVSICDACSHAHSEGLVGLNVMRHFVSELHGPDARLRLSPAPVEDRTTDIAPFVEMEVLGEPVLVSGHAHWRIEVENRGPRPLHGVRPRVAFGSGTVLLGTVIEVVAPGETASSRVVGPVREGDPAFTLALHEAAW